MSRILWLPVTSQWGEGASRFVRDCGAACLIMLLEYFGMRRGLTVDQVAWMTPLADGASGLNPIDLVRTGARLGLPLAVRTVTAQDIKAEIDAGRPVCVLLAYRFISGRLDQGDNQPGTDGHFINIVGYNSAPDGSIANWLGDDPDFWAPLTQRGHDLLIHFTELEQAMAIYGNQAVVVEVDKMSWQDQANAITANIRLQLDGLDALIAANSNPTPPPPPPPTPTPQPCTVTNAAGANIRSQPTISAGILKIYNVGTKLTVVDSLVDADTHRWMKVTAAPDTLAVGGFVAKDLLSFP